MASPRFGLGLSPFLWPNSTGDMTSEYTPPHIASLLYTGVIYCAGCLLQIWSSNVVPQRTYICHIYRNLFLLSFQVCYFTRYTYICEIGLSFFLPTVPVSQLLGSNPMSLANLSFPFSSSPPRNLVRGKESGGESQEA